MHPALTVAGQPLQYLWSQFLSFTWPVLCLLCDNPTTRRTPWLCTNCLEQLERNAAQRLPCARCGVNHATTECTCDLVWDHPFSRIVSLLDYDEQTAACMRHIKYHGRRSLARFLAAHLAPALPAGFFDEAAALVPVPLHPLRRLRRGYNQAEVIAAGVLCAATTPPPVRTDILKRRRNTATQTRLDRDQRRHNLRGAFALTPAGRSWIRDRIVILVDDVVTTGATSASCSEPLLAAGAREVRVLSLARD